MSRDAESRRVSALREEMQELRHQLAEAEETLRAIREGEVDAIVVSGSQGDQVFSLTGAEHVYRLIVETMKEAALTVTTDGRILFCNSRFGAFVHTPLERILGRPLHEFVAPDQRALLAPLLRQSQSDPVRGRLVFQGAEGPLVPAHISATVLHQPEGLSICVVATDLTELEASMEMLRLVRTQQEELAQSEQRLLETTQRLEALLKALPVGVSFSTDATCRRISGNPTLFAQFETESTGNLSASAQDADDVGRRVRYYQGGKEVGTADLPLQRAVAEKRMIPPMELEVELPSGRRWFAEAVASPVLDGQGDVIGGVAVTLDITTRKQTEATLARHRTWQEAKVMIGAAAVSGEPTEVVLTAALDAVVPATGALVGLIRLVEAETGDLVIAAERNVPPAYRRVASRVKRGEHLAGRVAATGRAQIAEDILEKPTLGSLTGLSELRIGSLICVPLKAQGQVLGTVTLGHPERRGLGAADAKELYVCADMLAGAVRAEQLREALRREADARAVLLRELDHRVRNTLAILIGLLNLTAEHTDASTRAVLQATAERVARLADVHAILAAEGQGRANLRQLVEMVAKSVLDLAAPVGHYSWSVDVPPIELRSSQAATIALVLHELFTNCIKHAFRETADGTVSVEGRRDGQDVHLTVCDDGRGVSPTEIRAGAGLSIVETLVTHTLRGALWRVEARGGGLLTHMRLPLQEDAESGASP